MLREQCPLEWKVYTETVPKMLHGHFAVENTNGFERFVRAHLSGVAAAAEAGAYHPETGHPWLVLPSHHSPLPADGLRLRVRGGRVIYGDTDSVFVNFPSLELARGEEEDWRPVEDCADTICLHFALGHWAARLVSTFLPPPMDLLFEKSFRQFLLLSKKKYIGYMYESSPHKCKLKYMGLNMKRKDACYFAKDAAKWIREGLG
jgi:DNA polymerase elongation subunit (family B)